MKSMRVSIFLVASLAVAACVTINVYFPEAAAQEAADRFIDKVIGPEEEAGTAPGDPQAMSRGELPRGLAWLDFFLPAAHAQANIDINTPAIQAIQRRMAERFDRELAPFFDSGAIGFGNDATVRVRDLSAVGLRDRNAVQAAVAAENRDREAVYREIAVANGHPEWEQEIRQTFAERWIARARAGWYYQDARGTWKQK